MAFDAASTTSPSVSGDDKLLAAFFSEFLDENEFADFRRLEKLVASLKQRGGTYAGHPAIRPRDCGKITQELQALFERARPQFRLRDEAVVRRFEAIINDFTSYCATVYPSEASAALTLHGQVLLFMGEPGRVLDVVSSWVERPYALESTDHILNLVDLYCQAHLRLGTLHETNLSFVALGDWLAVNSRSHNPAMLGAKLAAYMRFDNATRTGPLRARLIGIAASGLLKGMRTHGAILNKVLAFLMRRFWHTVLAVCFAWAGRPARFRSPYSLSMNPAGGTLVARGMGGIGDLLMMEPGLEALARKQGHRVDFAIPRKFFPVFNGNPHIRLIDIHGPAIDIASYRYFVNLSNCPASRYESGVRPFIRKGRVEVFASAMGVERRELLRQGWKINQFQQEEETAFCDKFLAEKGFGNRSIVGVQPFSRDSYKDYPSIGQVIENLAKHYDVLVFHHVEDGLPQGPGIATTAGLPLKKSLALMGRLNAMVSVDSAFLHAAAAYDYPVIALFGPTDARVLTRHHHKPVILWKPELFACVPCWRNEDSPCAVTELRAAKFRRSGLLRAGQTLEALVSYSTTSPCVAAIAPDEVLNAVHDALQAVC